jgi:hypothetical protein
VYPIYYYVGYRDRLIETKAAKFSTGVDPLEEDWQIQAAKALELIKRTERALFVANQIGIEERYVLVEAYTNDLPADGKYMALLNSGRPAIIIMDSLSMFLQQFGMSYWITLLRRSLQAGFLPITLEEYSRRVHLEYDTALQTRLVVIEALTEHIRTEPKRVRGRRKLGPVAELIERILIETASRNINSDGAVIRTISAWYDDTAHRTPERLQRDLIFNDKRWVTYKYKVRTMARDLLTERWARHYPEFKIHDDIWQASFMIDDQLVYPSAFAAAKLLPEFGYEKFGSRWIKCRPDDHLT